MHTFIFVLSVCTSKIAARGGEKKALSLDAASDTDALSLLQLGKIELLHRKSETLHHKILPLQDGKPYGAFVMPDRRQALGACKLITGADWAPRSICKSEVVHKGSFFEKYRRVAFEKPVQCLKDKLPDIYARMCQLCSSSRLDGFVFLGTARGHSPCETRFELLKRMAKVIRHGGSGGEKFVQEVRNVSTWMEQHYEEVPSWEESFNATGRQLFNKGNFTIADANQDGSVSIAEARDYMKTVYIITSVVEEAIIPGKEVALKNATKTHKRPFSFYNMASWVGGGVYNI